MTKKLHVVKFGSSLLTDDGHISIEKFASYAEYLSAMVDDERALIVVTSGALAAGKQQAKKLGQDGLSNEILSGMGFAVVFNMWQEAFSARGIATATTGLTHHQLGVGRWFHRVANRSELNLFRNTLKEACVAGVVLIVNESDMISNNELIKLQTGGDNDGIAARIAEITAAHGLTIFTELGGVVDESGALITQINSGNYFAIQQMVSTRETSETGRGGMSTKLEACWNAVNSGVQEVSISAISDNKDGHNLTRFMIG